MRAFNTLTLLAVTVSAYIRDYSDDLWDSEGNKTCRAEAELTSPSWLHRWIGTYYNGTIEVTVHVDRGDHCAEWPALFNETYAGVLSLLDAKYAGPASDIRHTSGYTNPFAFLLDGWAPNTTQASLFANRSTESYLPPAVKLEMESIYWFRHFSLEVLPWDLQNEHLTPNCKVSNATISAASGYNFTCPYRGEPFSDDSQFSLPISACNATNTAPFIAGIRRGYYTYKMRSSSSLRGTFNEKSADFEWDLGFSGAFTTDPIRQWNSSTYLDIVGGVRPDWQTGIFTMKFKGNVDNEHSHQMVLGPGSNLSWVEDVDKTKDNTFCAAALNVTLDESLEHQDFQGYQKGHTPIAFLPDNDHMALLGLTVPALKKLAVPFVCGLIAFLSYSSQYLFYHLEPGPLTTKEAAWFNTLIVCIWLTYERACRLDPGRLPKSLAEGGGRDGQETAKAADAPAKELRAGNWCKKCDAVKPPRAHHCRQCNRCIPKMDHHCPWTSNCVSHTTFPHFLRFVFYSVVSMGVLEYHLFNRGAVVYQNRNLPSYLGPSPYALAHLIILFATNSLALFILLILLVSACNSLAMNTTMIESWVIERHESLANKARYHGGFVHGPGGRRIRIRKQEFPYDIGIWANLVQGMGTPNVLAWLLPFAGDPGNETGWEFPVNGFEDPDVSWPPPDPDRMAQEPWSRIGGDRKEGFLHGDGGDEVQEFRRRQQQDYEKRGLVGRGLGGRNRQASGAPGSYDWLELDGEEGDGSEYDGQEEDAGGSDGWFNSDGDRLRDYGVDEEAELVDWEEDDDIPLGELLRRRRGRAVEVDT
ncbi:hypothetical protein V500_07188 [Pseudogymnoascus sp. VKM F-4518 (FW-2643)]|nr:hypothetical protein V500_07188 [Pseudogymnoascus sp. VKM F-4518 (FW-2643)]